jgi:hypothetical protein
VDIASDVRACCNTPVRGKRCLFQLKFRLQGYKPAVCVRGVILLAKVREKLVLTKWVASEK